MRDWKGIKILLAICPSSHRGGPPTLTRGILESETEPCELSLELVFAVLVSGMLGFLPLPLCWVCFAFSFCWGDFCWVGILLCLAPPRAPQARVVSARLNLSHGTIYVREFVISSVLSRHSKNLKQHADLCYSSVYVRGVCNFPGSVSLCQKFEAMDGPVLQLSFIWQAKENVS